MSKVYVCPECGKDVIYINIQGWVCSNKKCDEIFYGTFDEAPSHEVIEYLKEKTDGKD